MPPSLPGWIWNGARLVSDDTVGGAVARGMAVGAACRLYPECTRRVTLDLRALVGLGLGRMPIHEIRKLFECGRRPSCGLSWSDTYSKGAPLQGYVGDQTVTFTVRCAACGASRTYDVEQIIGGLRRTGRGDGNTGVLVAARHFQRSCRLCGDRRWELNLSRPPPAGTGQRAG